MAAQRVPAGPPAPAPVQRLRLRYARRGRLRFSSGRDFQRALERALRLARVPMAYSSGFHPHPRISYANAAPTGCASEAEYVELALAQRVDPAELVRAVDAALPAGLDILDAVEAGPGSLAERLEASHWRFVFDGADDRGYDEPGDTPGLLMALDRFTAAATVEVTRVTKSGPKTFDVRAPVISIGLRRRVPRGQAEEVEVLTRADSDDDSHEDSHEDSQDGSRDDVPVDIAAGEPLPRTRQPGWHWSAARPSFGADDGAADGADGGADGGADESGPRCAILEMVVRHTTPAVRPDDILRALRSVADFTPSTPPLVTRLAQGPLPGGRPPVADPLASDRAVIGTSER